MPIHPLRQAFMLPGLALLAAAFLAACSPERNDKLEIPTGLPGASASTPADLPPGHPPMPTTGAETLPGMPRDLAAPPPAHPPRSGVPAKLNVPAEVKATWKSVELSVSVAGQAHTLRVAVGAETAIPGSSLTLRILAYLPTFQIGNDGITSAGNNPDNPAVLLRLTDKGQTLAEGWVFQNLPDFNSFKTEKVRVRLLSATR
jgi:hypothetical protein